MNNYVKAGEWVWAVPLQHAVQIQSVATLWGVTIITAIDATGMIHEIDVEDVSPLESFASGLTQPSMLIHVAAGAKLANHLNHAHTLTAPFYSGLLPLPHQISHLEKALSCDTTRLLLADEVGLGKTITAGLILTELVQRGVVNRILILTPSGLVPQWIQEMKQHFSLQLTPLFTQLMATPENGSVWKQHDYVVASYDAVKPISRRRGWTLEQICEYNQNRFDALLDASWDIVVIDEAHRVAGATAGVARSALAAGLSTIAPNMLILTGTPHQGKADHFHRLVQLLDPATFVTPETVTPQNLSRHLLRTEKRNAVTLEGEPLFGARKTELRVIPREARSQNHQRLYEEVTQYIRTGYAAAENNSRSGLGFLMVLVQRLLASSSAALEKTLKERLNFLRQAQSEPEIDQEEGFLDPDSDLHEEVIKSSSFGNSTEICMIEALLSLVQICQREGPDPKASYLLGLMRDIQQREANPLNKFLIFTEFSGTQNMLAEFLLRHGYSVTTLNGSMGLEERLASQERFKHNAQVMVSTEAGGEGLNLQFCHIVVNFDLPWNPMRIEQRIGRVHRIGQKHPVFAYNLVLNGTVEHHVVEVLGEKLELIMNQLGIDKLGDVLDTPSIDSEVQRIYSNALVKHESELEAAVNELAARIKAQVEIATTENSLRSSEIDLKAIRMRLAEPVQFWLEQFSNHAPSNVLPDLKLEGTRAALQGLQKWIPGTPIPCVQLLDYPSPLRGTWSLWRVGLHDGTGAISTQYHPILLEGETQRTGPLALDVWDAIVAGRFMLENELLQSETQNVMNASWTAASETCRGTYSRMLSTHRGRCDDDERRHNDSMAARRNAIQSIGLEEVRQFRLRKLAVAHDEWQVNHNQRKRVRPLLEPILFLEIRGGRT